MLSRPSISDKQRESNAKMSLSIRLKRFAIFSLALIGPSLLGCSAINGLSQELAYNDSFSEWVISQRNAAFAAKAWHLRKHHFCNEKYLDDFCAGFRAGYMDVAAGGNGCTPAFPPQDYWSWKYQTAEGQARTAAWFAGYPHGARAAEEDGVGHFSQLQMSSTTFNEYHQAGAPGTESHLYPMPEPLPYHVPQNANVGAAGVAPQQAIIDGANPLPQEAAIPNVGPMGAPFGVGLPQ